MGVKGIHYWAPSLLGLRSAFGLAVAAWVALGSATAAAFSGETNGVTGYSVRRFSGDDGLPQDAASCVIQAADGHLWVGTGFGLARYDGDEFTVNDRFNSPWLISDTITALADDGRGRVWIGTTRGLAVYQQGQFSNWKQLSHLPSERITTVLASRAGSIWVGSSHGLTRLHEDWVERFGEAAGLESEDVREVSETPDGRLLVHTALGWQEFEPRVGRFFAARERFIPRPGVLAALPADGEGRAWIAEPGGISVNLGGTWQPVAGVPGDRSLREVSFYVHASFGLLVQVESLGAFRWDGRKLVPLKVDRPAWLTRFRAACVDREENLWLATADGLLQLQRRSVRVVGLQEGLPDERASTLSEGPDGTIWAGTATGLSGVRGGKVAVRVPVPRTGKDSGVITLAARDGRVWFSSGDRTVSAFSPNQGDQAPLTLSLGQRNVRCLYEDQAGLIWIGTSAGVAKIRGQSLEPFPGEEALAIYDVRALQQDSRGSFWIGTHGSGLVRLEGGEVKSATPGAGVPGSDIRAICECRRGHLWVGTAAGLHLLLGDRWRMFTREDGLAENLINQILEDNEGRLWVGGVRGIHGTPISDLTALMEGRIDRVRCLTLNHFDGMVGSETSGGLQPAGCRDQQGNLWFPTPSGLVQITPRLVRANTQPPNVLIKRVVADSHELPPAAVFSALRRGTNPPAAPFNLHRRQARNLTFHFTAPTFIQNELVHFRYRLKGYDKAWRKADGARLASYTNLRPGSYEFEVEAANAHGYWSTSPAAIAFKLAPFFYETGVFYLLCVFVVVGGGVATARVYHLRRVVSLQRSHKELERERARIAKDLHDDIGASLTGLALQADLASRGLEGQARNELETYADRSRNLVERLREVVWAVNPECDGLDNFATYLTHYLEGLPSDAARFQIDIPASLPPLELRSEVRHNLLMVFKEAIHNALRHSGAREIRVSLRLEGGMLTLVVADDGRGLPEEAAAGDGGQGFGFVNMRERIAGIGGRVDIVSRPGEGTRVTFEVNLGAAEPAPALNPEKTSG